MIKRNTKQKKLVADAVRMVRKHPTAEEVYSYIVKEYSDISKGTVYRILNSLVEDGELRKIQIPDSADRFDITLTDHYHVCCTSCGRFEDIPIYEGEKLVEEAETVTDFTITGHDIVFTGLCPDCAERT